MAINLPYLATASSLKNALERIRVAATPDRVTRDFVTTKLQIKGGTGAAIIPYLKKIGLVGSDGTPTDLYKRFRNQTTGGAAIADAIKIGYSPLTQVNEYFYELPDNELLSLIVQITGAESGNSTAKAILATFKYLKAFADFETQSSPEPVQVIEHTSTRGTAFQESHTAPDKSQSLGLNLSYTINLNLPATSDQAVFNAIFRSLKEHLLSNEE